MSLTPVATTSNLLLQSLEASDLDLLAPHFTKRPLTLRDVLVHPDQPIEDVCFPEYGIVSVVSSTRSGACVELGMFGRDGMSAPPLLLGVDRTPQKSFVQVEGSGLTIKAAILTEALHESASLHASLLKYVQTFMIQTAHTAAAMRGYKLEERLARWLLMCHDRLETDDLRLTHEFLAIMLAVRRSGVTVALQALAEAGMIRSRRGSVIILDRAKLLTLAGGSYGPPEAEYERLIAPLRPTRGGRVIAA